MLSCLSDETCVLSFLIIIILPPLLVSLFPWAHPHTWSWENGWRKMLLTLGTTHATFLLSTHLTSVSWITAKPQTGGSTHTTCRCSKQEMTLYCQPLFHLNCVFPLWQMDYIQNMGVSRWRQYLNLHKHALYWKLHPPVSKCLFFYLLGKSRDSCFIQCHL